MSKTYKTCTECGARLAEGAVQCTLCGSLVEAEDAAPATVVADEASAEPAAPAASPKEAAPASPTASRTGVFCNQCGWKNPPDARFCSMCGTALQAVDSSGQPTPGQPAQGQSAQGASSPAKTDAPLAPVVAPETAGTPEEDAAPAPSHSNADRQAVSRQVGVIVGAGVLLVVALFLVTAVSKTRPQTAPLPSAAQAPPPAVVPEEIPLPAQLAEQVAALEAEIPQLDGAARVARQRDLVSLFFGAGRLDRAALEQSKIAEATGALDDWKRAGDLFYDWMNTIQDPQRKAQAAGQAIAAYQTVLSQDPDNHDVRTDMATAYLNSGSPMQGVTEIRRVLDADPNHLHARFNYGLMLTWINRPEQAIEQFEQVKTLVDETSDYYQRADEAIRAIRQGGSL